MKRSAVLAGVMILSLLTGCGGIHPRWGPRRMTGRQKTPQEKKLDSKIEVQAFLYDARFILQGNRRSVRLEVFKDNGRVALAGRAYLGKSALKGWMTADSMLVYFPGSNEYIYESTVGMLASSTCLDSLPAVDFPALFTALAKDVLPAANFQVTEENGNDREKNKFACSVTSKGCPWEIDLLYEYKDGSCRLKSVEYTTDRGKEFQARLRTFKSRARVKPRRFEVSIPADARRMIP